MSEKIAQLKQTLMTACFKNVSECNCVWANC